MVKFSKNLIFRREKYLVKCRDTIVKCTKIEEKSIITIQNIFLASGKVSSMGIT